MPSFRLAASIRRRRSSAILTGLNPAKPGVYGIGLPPPHRPFMFAPNVTPVTFVEPENDHYSPESPLTPTLFPPSELPAAPSVRRRAPPGKRRSLGYIPRPPNAFMLFRADFVRQKHVPGSIETNHGSLSKIIGTCWKQLPPEERRVWDIKAKHAKAEHAARYPNYRFRPVHNKNKEKKKPKTLASPEDERRCEEVAQLLLEGKKGEQLAEAVRHLDRVRSQTPVNELAPVYHHRRSSSVPLPSHHIPHPNITLPTSNFFMPIRPESPMSHQQRMMLGQQRRPSSAGAAFFRSWNSDAPMVPGQLFHENIEALPDPDPTLLNTFSNFNFQPAHSLPQPATFTVDDLMTSLPPHAQPHDTNLNFGPLESFGPQDMLPMYNEDHTHAQAINNPSEVDVANWLTPCLQESPASHTSTASSVSPPDIRMTLPVFSPQPMHPDHPPPDSVLGGIQNLDPSDVWGSPELRFPHEEFAYPVADGTCANGVDFPFNNGGFDFGDFVKSEA